VALGCSHCGAPRTTAAAACPFCAALYSEAAPPGAPPGRFDAPPGVIEALNAENKIEAIRLYRAARKIGLREAKDAVERIERERK
jgi:ribosomal protein L7/L12